MSRIWRPALRIGFLFLLILLVSCGVSRESDRPPGGDLAGFFTLNAGQVPNPEVLLYHASGSMVAGFAESAILVKLVEPVSWEMGDPTAVGEEMLETHGSDLVHGVSLRVSFPGANRVVPEGRDELPFLTHYIHGSDPAEWRTDVPSFREVVYPDLYDGIDLVYRPGPGGLKYEFHLRPGADPREIEVSYEGTEGIELNPSGEIVVHTGLGDLRDSAPLSYLTRAAGTVFPERTVSAEEVPVEEVRSRYVLRSSTSYGFDVDGWDGTRPLIIDPLIYSTHLGGLWNDYVRSVGVDPDGFAYLAGWTVSLDFPVTRGTFQEAFTGSQEAFVAKLRGNGRALAWATYIGGTGQDDALSVQVDAARNVVVAGVTRSLDFPTTDGSTHAGGRFDAWIAKLDFAGRNLLFSTYLGGEGDDFGYSLGIDGNGFGYVAGFTRSTTFSTSADGYQPSHRGGTYDAFVAKVDTWGTGLAYFTFLGGTSVDYGWAIAVDGDGSAYVTGSTLSKDFPVTAGSFDETYNGTQDAFVTKISPDGTALVYSTFIGGLRFERGFSIAVDAAGQAHVGGATGSADFPVTPGVADELHGGGNDGFLVKVDSTGSVLLYGTYVGGADQDEVRGVAVDYQGETFVTGFTASEDFPVTPDAFDLTHNGGDDAFITHISLDGSRLVESTFLGGSAMDRGHTVAARPDVDRVYAAGETWSTDFPTTWRAHDPDQSGTRDGFVIKLRY